MPLMFGDDELDAATAIELLQTELLKAKRKRGRINIRPPAHAAEYAADMNDFWNVSLPEPVWSLVVETARLGLRKRHGRGRPRDSHFQRLRKEAIFEWARSEKARLLKSGLRPGVAEKRAAREAANLAGKRYSDNISENTILRKIQSKPKTGNK